MKNTTTLALFGSMFVGAAVLLGMVGSDVTALAVASTPADTFDQNAGIMGHIIMTVTDENGNITDYRQLDNTIGRTGADCAVVNLFGTTSGTENCADTGAAAFNFIELGIGGNAGSTGTCSGQPASTVATLGNNLVTADDANLGKKQATTRAATAAAGSGAVATLSTTFTPAAGTHAINEALLSNVVTANTGDVMAIQCFAPISITTTDTLTVEWVVTVSGA